MHRPTLLGFAAFAPIACLPWFPGEIDLTAGSVTNATAATEFDPSDPTTYHHDTDTVHASTGEPDPDTGTGDLSTSAVTAGATESASDTGTTYAMDDCSDIDNATLSLIPGMIGMDTPKIAVGPGCQILSTGKRAPGDPCMAVNVDPGPAYLAEASIEGACEQVVPLPGQTGKDIAAISLGALVVGQGPVDDDGALLVRITDTTITPFEASQYPALANALAVTDGLIYVTGRCDDRSQGCTGALWVAEFNDELHLLRDRCICDYPHPGQAVAVVGGRVVAIIAEPIGDIVEIIELDEDLIPYNAHSIDGATLKNWGVSMVAVPTGGAVIALACTGDQVGTASKWQTCESPAEQAQNPHGNIALLQLDDQRVITRVDVFGGDNSQGPTALVFSDEDTLWLAGAMLGGSITLGGFDATVQYSSPTDPAGFVARYALNNGVPTPEALYLLDNDASGAHSRPSDLAHDADGQRIVVTGTANGQVYLREDGNPGSSPSVAFNNDNQNFLAFIPIAL